jgi:hypothetical protein
LIFKSGDFIDKMNTLPSGAIYEIAKNLQKKNWHITEKLYLAISK